MGKCGNSESRKSPIRDGAITQKVVLGFRIVGHVGTGEIMGDCIEIRGWGNTEGRFGVESRWKLWGTVSEFVAGDGIVEGLSGVEGSGPICNRGGDKRISRAG